MIFDWLPEPKWMWFLILFGVCFGFAAIVEYDPCWIASWNPIFAAGYGVGGGNC
jgi:hypothetical protein